MIWSAPCESNCSSPRCLTEASLLHAGPEDTPYSGGCFLFDIYFPTTYPQVSPKVNLQTTGAGP